MTNHPDGLRVGRTCEKCGREKPDVRYAPDVRMDLCTPCWGRTPCHGPGRTPRDSS